MAIRRPSHAKIGIEGAMGLACTSSPVAWSDIRNGYFKKFYERDRKKAGERELWQDGYCWRRRVKNARDRIKRDAALEMEAGPPIIEPGKKS